MLWGKDLQLVVENRVVNQPYAAESRGNRNQYGGFTDFFDRLKRFAVNDGDVIELGNRLSFDFFAHDFSDSHGIPFAFFDGDFGFA